MSHPPPLRIYKCLLQNRKRRIIYSSNLFLLIMKFNNQNSTDFGTLKIRANDNSEKLKLGQTVIRNKRSFKTIKLRAYVKSERNKLGKMVIQEH